MSPEKYVRTQARTLPIFECVINDDWQTSGLCNIIVARQHKTGNVTIGIYLIDMYCLGVKGAQFDFNLYLDEYEDIKSRFSGDVCDYVLAHNIIFGAIAYAEDYGFKPHKDFETARFILDEDDEDVPLMELEFGLNGKPHYVSGPYDDSVKINNILAILERTAGEGNFTFTNLGSMFDDMDDEDFDDDGEEEDDEDIDRISNSYQVKSMVEIMKGINESLEALTKPGKANAMLIEHPIGSQYELSDEDGALEDNRFENDEQVAEHYRLRTLYNNRNVELVLTEFENAVAKYPDCPAFYNLLQVAYIDMLQYDKAEDTINLMYHTFPDYFPSIINYAGMLLANDKPEDVLAVFKGALDLNYLYPGHRVFHVGEALVYYACMCRYFIGIKDLDSADLYLNATLKYLDTVYFNQTDMIKVAAQELMSAKLDALEKTAESL